MKCQHSENLMKILTEIWTNATYLNSSLHYVDSVVDSVLSYYTARFGFDSCRG